MDVISRQLVLRNSGQCLKAKNNMHFATANPACYVLLTWVSGRGVGSVPKEENEQVALLLSCLYTSALPPGMAQHKSKIASFLFFNGVAVIQTSNYVICI